MRAHDRRQAWLLIAAVTMAVGASTSIASAQAPVALVEEVTGHPPGIEFMDYVLPGQVIRLAPDDSIVLGYLKSCWRETIKGGTVTAGTEKSELQGGKIERAKVECNGGAMQLSAAEASKSAALVFRDRPRPAQQPATPAPQLTLYGVSPVIEVKGGTLVVERLDKPGERLELTLDSDKLVRKSFYDFASAKQALAPGGIYRAKAGAQEIVFKVDPSAKPGAGPIVGRLVRFSPAS